MVTVSWTRPKRVCLTQRSLHTGANHRAEDALHKSRLLAIEEKPFKRITKRLLSPESLILSPPTALPTPPPDASSVDEAAASQETLRQKQAEERRLWREEMMLDFAAMEGSMVRIQLLQNSNAKERERYAAEKTKILETAQAIRDNTADLRVQLEEAQKMLALRKTYDELAEKITSNRMLRPREDQHAQLEKLSAEIEELEQESSDYARTWAERREQFGRIVEEGRQMLRLIRDEKEEAERKEGMEGGEAADDAEGSTTRGGTSLMGTPRPDMDGSTPMHTSQDGDDVTPARLAARSGLRPLPSSVGTGSRAPSPARPEVAREVEDGVVHDADMAEAGEPPVEGRATNDAEVEEGEEGEEEGEATPGESMDVT